jgi:hypothetical protein
VTALQTDLQAFTAAHGCYPLTVAQMEGWQPATEGQTASGDRVPLATKTASAPASAAPAPSSAGSDPLTGRDDSWIIDPLDPALITSTAFKVTVKIE